MRLLVLDRIWFVNVPVEFGLDSMEDSGDWQGG